MFTPETAATIAWNPTLESLDEKVSKYIGGNPVRLDGRPRASGILDTVSHCISGRSMLKLIADQVRAARAHGIRIPTELGDKAIMDRLVSCAKQSPSHALTVFQEKAVVEEWFSGCEDSVPFLSSYYS